MQQTGARFVRCGDDVGGQRLVACDLHLEHGAQLGGLHRHVHDELEIGKPLVNGIVEEGVGGQLRTLVGGESGHAAAADGADRVGQRVECVDGNVVQAGKLSECPAVGVVGPLLGPVDFLCYAANSCSPRT